MFATAQMKSVAYIFAVHVVNCLYLEYDTPVYCSQFCDGCSIMLNVALLCWSSLSFDTWIAKLLIFFNLAYICRHKSHCWAVWDFGKEDKRYWSSNHFNPVMQAHILFTRVVWWIDIWNYGVAFQGLRQHQLKSLVNMSNSRWKILAVVTKSRGSK